MGWLFGSLHGYRRSWLRGDLIAGLTVWAVLVPEALAYASIAGVSPVVGLYAAPGALIFSPGRNSRATSRQGPSAVTAGRSTAVIRKRARARVLDRPLRFACKRAAFSWSGHRWRVTCRPVRIPHGTT